MNKYSLPIFNISEHVPTMGTLIPITGCIWRLFPIVKVAQPSVGCRMKFELSTSGSGSNNDSHTIEEDCSSAPGFDFDDNDCNDCCSQKDHTKNDECRDYCLHSNSSTNAMVRKRWIMLADAMLMRRIRRCDREDIVMRCLNSFNLFQIRWLSDDNAESAMWCEYSVEVSGRCTSVNIRFSLRDFTLAELTGFNNTGNVRIWPSEEILAYVALKCEAFFRNKSILEVGGGMSCLAGLLLARRVRCHSIHVTDGNSNAVANVREIVKKNSFECPLSCDVLVWSSVSTVSATSTSSRIRPSTVNSYDVILAADCLFFDDCRNDLVGLMVALLKPNGTVLLVSPKRGNTLSKFAKAVRDSGLRCSIYRLYDDDIWSRHLQFKKCDDYIEDIHYPLLLLVNNAKEREIFWHELTVPV